MRAVALAAFVLSASALLSGCAGDPPAGPVADAVPPTPVLLNQTEEIAFRIPAGAGTPVVGVNAPVGPTDNGGPFDVPPDATVLVVEGEWTCASGPSCPLSILLYDGDRLEESEDAAASVRMEVKAPAEGGWRVAAFPSGGGSVVVDAQGSFRVTVAYLAEDAGGDAPRPDANR
jgi:hypothetical protein